MRTCTESSRLDAKFGVLQYPTYNLTPEEMATQVPSHNHSRLELGKGQADEETRPFCIKILPMHSDCLQYWIAVSLEALDWQLASGRVFLALYS